MGWVSALRLLDEDGSVTATYEASLKFAWGGDFNLFVWDEDGNQLTFEQVAEMVEAAAGWDTLVEVLEGTETAERGSR